MPAMSGNPFRRSAPPSAPQPQTSLGHDGSSNQWPAVDQKVPPRTKKHVRLASPPPSSPEPSSPEVDGSLVKRLSASRHDGSPPPPADLSDDSSVGTPFEDGPVNPDAQDDHAPLNSRHSTNMETVSRSSGVPNPFERTLANIEPADSEDTTRAASTAAERSAGHKARASMDVDSFKRLLMTGSATPSSASSSATADVQPRAHITIGGDNSNGTDASSLSKNSLFGSVLQVHEDSPRSSYERTSFDGGNDEDQSVLLRGERKTEKKKPPPPKHRHGKSITRAPQVVSFSDFSPSVAAPGTRPEGPQRTPSDKPLPPRPRTVSGQKQKELPSSPPVEPIASKDAAVENPLSDEAAENSPPLRTPEPAAPQRRKPPTPPLSRRHSQLKSVDARSRSNSGTTLSSQVEEAFASPVEQTPTTSPPPPATASSKPPPPPPTRRSGAPGSMADASKLSRSSSRRSTASSSIHPNPLRSSHRLSGSALDISSPTATSTASLPPPPPPRRGSSKSSFDMPRPSASVLAAAAGGGGSPDESRRTSMDFKGRSRTASGASERVWGEHSAGGSPVAMRAAEEHGRPNGMRSGSSGGGGGEGGGVDLLSELDKLQQEVEALRQKSGGARA